MKKTIISALVLMSGVLGFSGCVKNDDNISVETQDGKTITFVAEMDTRTIMTGEKPDFATAWEIGDKVGLYSFNIEYDQDGNHTEKNYNRNRTFTVQSISDTGAATMTGKTYNSASATGTHMFYGYYPCVENATDKYQSVQMNIPSKQTMPKSDTFDPKANIMVLKPMSVDLNSENLTFDNVRFRHTVAFINLNTKNISCEGVGGDEIVSTVKFEAVGISENPTLAGDFQFNLEDGTMTFTSEENAITNAITVNVPVNTKLSELSAWIVTNPFKMTADDKLEITINTDAHVIVKRVSIEKSFEAANVYTLNLTIDGNCDITKIEKPKDTIYELVTDASTLAEGDQVIIVAESNSKFNGKDYAMSISSNTANTNRHAEEVIKNDDNTIKNPSKETQIFILKTGSVNNTFAFYAYNGSNGYICAAGSGSGNNYLKIESNISGNSSWTIKIEPTNTSIVANGDKTNKTLQFNYTNSPSGTPNTIFSCYSSASQKPVQIYRLQDDRTPLASPIIAIEKDDTNKSIYVMWDNVENATSYVVSCTGQNGTPQSQTLNDAGEYTFTNLEYGEYTVKVTASADGYRPSSASETCEIINYQLSAPTSVTASGTATEIKASWDKVANASSYEWTLKKVENGTETPVEGKANISFTPAAEDLTDDKVNLTIAGPFNVNDQYVLYVKMQILNLNGV